MIWRLIYHKISKNILKTILIIATFFMTVFFTIFMLFFYNNVENFFIKKWIWDVNFKRFDIYLKSAVSSISLSNSWFDQASISKINELKFDPNIDKLYYFYNTKLPFSIKIDMFWNKIDTDVFLFVVSDNFFSDHWITNLSWDVLNFGISQSLIEFYNLQLANWEYFPKVPQELFYGISFDTFFWKSVFMNFAVNDYTQKWKIAVIDNILPVIWLTLPYSSAEKIFNQLWRNDILLNRVVWYAKTEWYVNVIESKFPEFSISSDQKIISKIEDKLLWLRVFLLLLNIVVVVVLINFLIYIIFSIIDWNKEIFHVFRVHWSSRAKMLWLIVIEMIYYILPVVLIIYLMYLLFNRYFFLYISKLLNEKFLLNYLLIPISFYELSLILIGFVVFVIGVSLISSIKVYTKKFEN